MRYRAVYWICFPILAILLFGLKYSLTGLWDALTETGYGLLFLLIQLLFLWVYFSVKNRKVVNLTNDYLGWGDILFLIVITFYLSPGNYVLFYIGSLILVLLYSIGMGGLQAKKSNKHIPLAGLQAMLLALLMITDYFFKAFTLYSDGWIYILMS
ncbi:hypothetical protein [Pedobacter sp. KBW06]|uniref:hypothetical protein n=1 Tax=Pedobacter sp. KBW06 TaxID=2153359 RepID=UPI000F58F849|nr:hypothetical protein [Pedobacter sp. KBW06]